MPPSAISNLPARSRLAPVKAPATCPNSSLSAMDSGSAAQLTWISASSRRGEVSWICRATSSLPTPVSPVMRTARSERGDQMDLVEQPARGRAGAEDLPAAGEPRAALQLARHLAPPLGRPLQRLDQAGRAHGGPGQRAERREHPRVEAIEGVRVERVRRERADDLRPFRERGSRDRRARARARAGRLQQAVEGIRRAGCPSGSEPVRRDAG